MLRLGPRSRICPAEFAPHKVKIVQAATDRQEQTAVLGDGNPVRSRRSNSGSRRSTAAPAGTAAPEAGCAWCAIRGVYWFWPVGSGCLPCRSLGLCVRKLPQGKVIRIRRIAVAALAAQEPKIIFNELAFPGDQKVIIHFFDLNDLSLQMAQIVHISVNDLYMVVL